MATRRGALKCDATHMHRLYIHARGSPVECNARHVTDLCCLVLRLQGFQGLSAAYPLRVLDVRQATPSPTQQDSRTPFLSIQIG